MTIIGHASSVPSRPAKGSYRRTGAIRQATGQGETAPANTERRTESNRERLGHRCAGGFFVARDSPPLPFPSRVIR